MSKPTNAELIEQARYEISVFERPSATNSILLADRLEEANSEANQYFKEAAEWESKHRGATRYIKELEAKLRASRSEVGTESDKVQRWQALFREAEQQLSEVREFEARLSSPLSTDEQFGFNKGWNALLIKITATLEEQP